MLIQELTSALEASTREIVVGLYALARDWPNEAQLTILNRGLDDRDLDRAEARIDHPLHPLHRAILRVSNGGTLPFVNSVGYLAAAEIREREWHWIVPPPPSTPDAIDRGAANGPFEPLLLGESVAEALDSTTVPRLHLDSFIFIASEQNGEFYGYVRGDPERIDVVSDVGRFPEARDFAAFLGEQYLYDICETPPFLDKRRVVLANL